jgi:DNA-directed RNA polymerase subunit RPC12/RpoP
MPDIHFECPKCKQTFDAPEELATQLIECPTCKETIEVPIRSQLKEAPKPPEPPKPAPTPPIPAPATPPRFELPYIQDSAVASALTFVSVLEFIASPIAGLGVGSDNTELGWLVFVSGVISGLILLGFAGVIQNTFESSQRLRRLEMLMERAYDKKPAA